MISTTPPKSVMTRNTPKDRNRVCDREDLCPSASFCKIFQDARPPEETDDTRLRAEDDSKQLMDICHSPSTRVFQTCFKAFSAPVLVWRHKGKFLIDTGKSQDERIENFKDGHEFIGGIASVKHAQALKNFAKDFEGTPEEFRSLMEQELGEKKHGGLKFV